MTVYLITLPEPTAALNRASVYSYPNREAAAAALRGDFGQLLIEHEGDVTQRGTALVDLYNAVDATASVKKFENTATGIRRLLRVLPTIAKEATMSEVHDEAAPSAGQTEEEAAKLAKRQAAEAEKAQKKVDREAAKLAKKEAAEAEKAQKKVDREAAKLAKKEAAEADKQAKKAAREARANQSAPPKLGKFEQVRESSPFGTFARAILNGDATLASLAPEGKDADYVAGVLTRARITYGVDHVIGEDGIVSLKLPDGISVEGLFKATAAERRITPPGERKVRAGKEPVAAAEFKKLRAGTIREKIVNLMDGTLTAAQIAERTGLTASNTSSHIFCLWRDCGLGFTYDAEGRVTVRLPEGVASDAVFQAAA